MEAPCFTIYPVAEYRRSPFARMWASTLEMVPEILVEHSPFFLFENAAVLWNQGLG
jgi:hypothetical protein